MWRASIVSLALLVVAGCSSAGEGVDDAGFDGEEAGGAAGASGGGGSATSGQAGASGQAGSAGQGKAGAGGGAAGQGGAGQGGAGQGGQAGSAGQAGGSGGGGAGKSGAGGGCVDTGVEPNDSEALATPACGAAPCEVGDKDSDGSAAYGGSHTSIAGTVGAGDGDYFFFQGKDNLGNVVDPAAKTDQGGFTLCIFTTCDSGETQSFKCTAGTPTKSPGGLSGCCVQAPGEVHSDHDCKGSILDDDAAKVIIRIDQANACTPYLVDYHF